MNLVGKVTGPIELCVASNGEAGAGGKCQG